MQIESSPLKDALEMELLPAAGHLAEGRKRVKNRKPLPLTIPATQISK
jgi:hypothetical protein